jgi:hypothetical protein
MAYIGKQPVVGNFVKLDAITTSATATYNLLNSGVAYFPQSANNCIVSLNGVIQSPTSAYTISGSTIVFSDALTSSDTIDFILVLGDVLSIGTPSDGTITSAKLASGTDGLFAWQSVQTTGFTAVAARAYPCNTTSAAFTVTLPASPSVGDQVAIVDYAGTFATNAITLSPNGLKINGSTSNRLLNTSREGVIITYIDSTQGWLASSGVNEGTVALSPEPYSVDFLVIAGGGSGATSSGASDSEGGGGGGAGGYRTSTQTVSGGTVITVTVGDGAAAITPSNTIGNDGSSSSISGSGLTTITSTGGGGGGNTATSGRSGGSGGGGGAGPTGPSYPGGAGNTPSTSPSQGNNGGAGTDAARAAGGGGAGAVGQNASANGPGIGANGGSGTASSITGSSVTRAGGGGGGSYSTGGTGGSGGGGGGGTTSGSVSGTAGTVNTGSGGGGSSQNSSSGAGGKGVVILSMPDASYSGTTTGSPTVATGVSGKTVLTFTGSGSYTT